MADGTSYDDDGYKVLPGLVPPVVVRFLVRYVDILLSADRLGTDSQVPGALRLYGDPAFDTLLDGCTEAISEAISLDLVPTYSFVRRYARGQELAPHRDRASCEHSVSVNLGASSEDPWPIRLRCEDGLVVSVDLKPGDGLLYQGTRVMHWRDPLPGAWHLQAFLHYVHRNGPFAHEAYDGRGGLGRPRQ